MKENVLQEALDAVHENGCPNCGEEVLSTNVEGPEKISVLPCGHFFPYETALAKFG